MKLKFILDDLFVSSNRSEEDWKQSKDLITKQKQQEKIDKHNLKGDLIRYDNVNRRDESNKISGVIGLNMEICAS